MNETKELTVREATILTLENSQEGLEELRKKFQEASEAFDSGKDAEGLNIMKDHIILPVSDLYEFCFTIAHAFDDVLSDEICEKLKKNIEQLDILMKSIGDETESGNFTEVGDILRFDFYDLMDSLSRLFPQIAESFRTSDREDLDKY